MKVNCEIRDLIEFAKPAKVDRLENGTIVLRRCKYLGARSVNVNGDGTQNVYSLEMRRATQDHYDGAKVFVDHPPASTPGAVRGYGEQLARLHKPFEHLEEGSFADVHVNPKHKFAEKVAWDAEHSPDSLGLSHNALGYGRKVGKKDFMVEGMRRVRSVDLVPAGATTTGLYEGRTEEADVDPKTVIMKALKTIAELQEQLDESALLAILTDPQMVADEKVMQALSLIAKSAIAPEGDGDGDSDGDGASASGGAPSSAVEGKADGGKASAGDLELREANRELERKVDALEALEAKRERHKRRDVLLSESMLPEDALSGLFVGDVRDAASDERAKNLVEERKKIWFTDRPVAGRGHGGSSGKRVKNMGAFLRSGKES